MLVLKYKDINRKNIIIKKNNQIYYSTKHFTLNSLAINLTFKNIKINYNKAIFNRKDNIHIINNLNVLELSILNNYFIKFPIYNIRKMLNKNILYIKNKLFNNTTFYKKVDIVLIIKGININNRCSFLNFEFVIHPLNNN